MAKQSLIDFQQHFMERLKSAEAAPGAAGWLGVEAAGGHYLLPLTEAGEIFQLSALPELVAVAHTRPWFLGVANLRGTPVGVTDLAGWLGLRGAGSEPARESACLVAFNPALEINGALLVDRLAGLRAPGALKPTEQGDDGVQRHVDADGQVWEVLSLAALARDERFLEIAA